MVRCFRRTQGCIKFQGEYIEHGHNDIGGDFIDTGIINLRDLTPTAVILDIVVLVFLPSPLLNFVRAQFGAFVPSMKFSYLVKRSNECGRTTSSEVTKNSNMKPFYPL